MKIVLIFIVFFYNLLSASQTIKLARDDNSSSQKKLNQSIKILYTGIDISSNSPMTKKLKLLKIKKENLDRYNTYNIKNTIHNGLVSIDDIDDTKHIIQLGVLSNRQNIYNEIELFSDFNLYLKPYKQINSKQTYQLFIVNINSNSLKKTLEFAKSKTPDAFLNKNARVREQKITLTSTIENNTSNSNELNLIQQKKNKISPSQKELYLAAVYFYNQKNFKLAYSHFANYSNNKSVLKRSNFLQGRSAFNTKQYDEALNSYNKVLKDDPSNVRTKLEVAQTHMKKQNYEKAEKFFIEILNKKILPQGVKYSIQKNISIAKQKKKKHFFNLLLIGGYSYDSNINNSADAGEYSIYIPSEDVSITLNNNGESTPDSILQLSLTANYVNKIKDEFILENSATVFTQKHNKHSDKNMNVLSFNFAPAYFINQNKLSIKLGYDKITLDDKSYLHSYSITPNINKTIDKTLTYKAHIKLSTKKFNNLADIEKDSTTTEILNALNFISDKYGIFGSTLTVSQEKKTSGVRTDIDNQYLLLTLSNTYNLGRGISLINTLNTSSIKYLDSDVNFLSKRSDSKIDYTIGLLKPINKKTTIGCNYQNIQNDSNHSPFTYNKWMLKTFISYSF